MSKKKRLRPLRDAWARSFLGLFLATITFSLASCTMALDGPEPVRTDLSRLILYLHSTSDAPPDIIFTISGISMVAADGKGETNISADSIDIGSIEMVGRQTHLKEALIVPGRYSGIRIKFLSASVKRKEGYVNLSLPQPSGEAVFEGDISIKPMQTMVVALAWDPDKSVVSGYQFQPSITVEPQAPSAREVLLFVSNSGADYISIIDRALERVIGAVTVREKPMGMALSPLQDRLYVVNSLSRTVSIVDTSQFRILDEVQLAAGIDPTDIVFMPEAGNQLDGKLYITNRTSNDVTVVSTATRRVLKSIKAGTTPSAIAGDPVRKEVYVANERSNNLSVINATDDTVVSTIGVETRPTGVTVGGGKVYVMNEGSNTISIISPSQRKVTGTVSLLHPPKRALYGLGNRLFVANSSADTVTSLNSLDVMSRTFRAGKSPVGMAGDEKRSRLYITNLKSGTVSVLDGVGERVVKEIQVGRNPYGAVLLDR
jgi:YVTN family beta-propeller protein